MNKPALNLFRKNRMPVFLVTTLVIFFSTACLNTIQAQCGYAAGLGCAGTDYNNFGYNATNSPSTIEYDNYSSGQRQTAVRTANGSFLLWGQNMANNGTSSVLSPRVLDATNYPDLTGTVLKVGIGSSSDYQQTIILTTTGLFALGREGLVIADNLTDKTDLSKLTVNGKADGLPSGVSPADVKMMFVTYKTLVITTCSGNVWVLTENAEMRGNNNTGSSDTWSKVTTDETGNPELTGIVATRGSGTALIALRNDNTIWTWGKTAFVGDGTDRAVISRAQKMISPSAGTIKMIGGTSDGTRSSYYVLLIDGSLYSLGDNGKKQLGDWTSELKASTWVQPRYNSQSGPVMKNIRWISPMEHDWKYPSINVITTDMKLYNWGDEQEYSLGRGNLTETAVDPGIPAGFSATDKILSVATGGRSTMFTVLCEDNIGFVGLRINGSMGDGTALTNPEADPYYSSVPTPVCGTVPIINAWGVTNGPSGKVCESSNILLDPLPSGGSLTVVSGPGTITGNVLSFTGTGTVVVQYELTLPCGVKTTTRTFETESCTLYRIKGSVWTDENANVIIEMAEQGTNTGTGITDGLWANLVNTGENVIQSVPVDNPGTYELATTAEGNYSVEITNGQIALGAKIPPSSNLLPANWEYTGNNDGTPCLVPACVTPFKISGIDLGSGSPQAIDLNFGINQRALPIKLVSFNVYKDGDAAKLTWITGTEQNNRGFEIQRSSDGKNWATISWVDTRSEGGNSPVALAYSYTDNYPLSGTNFYQLKQIDLDGRNTYSEIRSIQFNNSRSYTVYPNPASDIITVRGLTAGEVIKVFDFSGRLLSSQKASGPSKIVNISHYLPGIYQISVTDINGASNTFKIVKQ